MAHNGVMHPEVWERWATKDIIFRVFCNEEFSKQPFTVGRRLNINIKTAWATPSLVHVLQLGYDEILQEFAAEDMNLRMIYLVSGYDVPIMPVKDLLEMRAKKSYIGISGEIPSLENRNIKLFRETEDEPRFFATQWIHVIPRDALIISRANLSNYVQWLDKINEHLVGHDRYVYDEVLPCAMLQMAGVDFSSEIYDDALTDFERENKDDPSPIQWDSWNTERKVYRETGSIQRSLCQTLRHSISEQYCFFRKVLPAVNLDNIDTWLAHKC